MANTQATSKKRTKASAKPKASAKHVQPQPQPTVVYTPVTFPVVRTNPALSVGIFAAGLLAGGYLVKRFWNDVVTAPRVAEAVTPSLPVKPVVVTQAAQPATAPKKAKKQKVKPIAVEEAPAATPSVKADLTTYIIDTAGLATSVPFAMPFRTPPGMVEQTKDKVMGAELKFDDSFVN